MLVVFGLLSKNQGSCCSYFSLLTKKIWQTLIADGFSISQWLHRLIHHRNSPVSLSIPTCLCRFQACLETMCLVLSVWLFLGKFSNVGCHVRKFNIVRYQKQYIGFGVLIDCALDSDCKARGSGFKPWGNYIHC